MKALAFSFPPQANPEGLVQITQHLTPELVLPCCSRPEPGTARAPPSGGRDSTIAPVTGSATQMN
jgi:hypothetical protein